MLRSFFLLHRCSANQMNKNFGNETEERNTPKITKTTWWFGGPLGDREWILNSGSVRPGFWVVCPGKPNSQYTCRFHSCMRALWSVYTKHQKQCLGCTDYSKRKAAWMKNNEKATKLSRQAHTVASHLLSCFQRVVTLLGCARGPLAQGHRAGGREAKTRELQSTALPPGSRRGHMVSLLCSQDILTKQSLVSVRHFPGRIPHK